MSSDDGRLIKAFDDSLRRAYQRSRIPAKLGKGDGSTLYVYDSDGNQVVGSVWARLDGEHAPRKIWAGDAPTLYGLSVTVFIDSEGEYVIEGVQRASAKAYFEDTGNYIPTGGAHGITHGYFAPDPILLDSRQFFPLSVRPTNPPSLSVRIEPGWYYIDGEEYPWVGGTIDLSSYVPGGANEQVPLIVSLDTNTIMPAAYEGTTITSSSAGIPFTKTDVNGITVADPVLRLAAVRLKNGQTEIGLVDIFEDLRPFFLAGSSGSGSGFANTALSNLTTPTAINQHLLPGADGGVNLGNITKRFGIANIMGLTMSTAYEAQLLGGVATLSVSPTVRVIVRAETGSTDTLTNIERGAGGTPTDGLFLLLSAYTGHTITVDDGSGVTGITVDRTFTFGENDIVVVYYDENADKWKFLAPNMAVIPASQVTAGTFGTGNYTITGDLVVDQIGLWGTAVGANTGLALDKTLALAGYTIGLQSYLTKNTADANTLSGVEGYLTLSAASGTDSSAMFGVYGGVNISGNANQSGSIYGFNSEVYHSGSGTVAAAYGLYSKVAKSGGGVMTNGYGVYIDVTETGAGSLTNAYGLYVGTLASATNQTAILTTDGHVIFNESGADTDVRMETDTDANAFFLDGGASSLGLGTGTPSDKTIFDVVSTTRASRPLPTMTTTQRNAITSPVTAGLIYNSTTTQFEWYGGAAWIGIVDLSTAQTLTNKSIVASQITAGTFASGNFTFPNDLRVSGHMGIGTAASSTTVLNVFETSTATTGITGAAATLVATPSGTLSPGHTALASSVFIRSNQTINGVQRGFSSSVTVDTTSGATINNMQSALITVTGTNGFTGTVTNASAIRGIVSAGDLTVGTAIGADFTGTSTNNGVVTTSIAFRVIEGSKTGTGSITTQYGIQIGDQTIGGTNYAIETNAGLIVFNQSGHANADFRVEGDTDANLINTDASTETFAVGVAAGSHIAKLHVDQFSTTFAKPVLALDQADVSEEFIRFIGTSANGVLTQSIVEEADITTATRAGWVKVYVQDDGNQLTDQAYFLPVYTLA